MSEGIFSEFFKNQAVQQRKLPISVLEEKEESNISTIQTFESKITGISPEKIIEIQEYAERFVREDTQNRTDIFKDPTEFNNKNAIETSIKKGIKSYMDRYKMLTLPSSANFQLQQNIWNELRWLWASSVTILRLKFLAITAVRNHARLLWIEG